MKPIAGLICCAVFLSPLSAADDAFPLKARRILFLGDSITHAGGFVSMVELQLRLQSVAPVPELVNAGLPSETCSGLSEPDHPFPRPDIHERLDRALAAVKPDVVVACYGMNDGIYYPFSEDRFQKYQDGISRLIQKVHASGAKLVLMTPPPFDAMPLKAAGKLLPEGSDKFAWFAVYENYDQVIERYAKWILEQKDHVEMVIDLHTPISAFWAQQRKVDPGFTVAPDGVHCNSTGHRTIAEVFLKACGVESWMPISDDMTQLMEQKTAVLRDSWLSRIGHKRPGMTDGLSLEAATARAAEIDLQLQPLIQEARKPVCLLPGTTTRSRLRLAVQRSGAGQGGSLSSLPKKPNAENSPDNTVVALPMRVLSGSFGILQTVDCALQCSHNPLPTAARLDGARVTQHSSGQSTRIEQYRFRAEPGLRANGGRAESIHSTASGSVSGFSIARQLGHRSLLQSTPSEGPGPRCCTETCPANPPAGRVPVSVSTVHRPTDFLYEMDRQDSNGRCEVPIPSGHSGDTVHSDNC
jgi:lysophospholipase L1-like esterase